MKLKTIAKLLKSDSKEDVLIGYNLLIKRYKRLWIANMFLGKHDLLICKSIARPKSRVVYWNRTPDDLGAYYQNFREIKP